MKTAPALQPPFIQSVLNLGEMIQRGFLGPVIMPPVSDGAVVWRSFCHLLMVIFAFLMHIITYPVHLIAQPLRKHPEWWSE